jgi:hypothetical protein
LISRNPVTTERRTWSTEVRDPWNGKIHSALQSVDLHVSLYFKTGDPLHLEMADTLRQYVLCLKAWIHRTEGR